MAQFTLTVAGKAANSVGQTIYPSVIASSIIQAAGLIQSIAIAVKENEPVLVKADKKSTIGLQFDGEEPIYGAEKVLRTLIDRFPAQLGARSELVIAPPFLTIIIGFILTLRATSIGGILGQFYAHKTVPW